MLEVFTGIYNYMETPVRERELSNVFIIGTIFYHAAGYRLFLLYTVGFFNNTLLITGRSTIRRNSVGYGPIKIRFAQTPIRVYSI